MAKITAQDFGTVKKHFDATFYNKTNFFLKAISYHSPTKLQVMPLSQKKKLSEIYFWCSATTLVNYSLSRVENKSFFLLLLLFFFLVLNRLEEPWTHKPSQAGQLLFRHSLSSDTSTSWSTRKPQAFFQDQRKQSVTQMLGSLTFLPSPWPSSLKKYPSCICKTAPCINEVTGLTDRVPIT